MICRARDIAVRAATTLSRNLRPASFVDENIYGKASSATPMFFKWEAIMSLGTILLIILILILVGALPTWPYSSGWGYYPAGGLGLVLIILLILVLLGRL
jgi:Protein of unknown function (DUF3309)